jgi:hypothetical protein
VSTGAALGAFPKTVRARWWTGPGYGLLVWLGFELGIAPMLGLKQSKCVRPVDRLALATETTALRPGAVRAAAKRARLSLGLARQPLLSTNLVVSVGDQP